MYATHIQMYMYMYHTVHVQVQTCLKKRLTVRVTGLKFCDIWDMA